MLWLSGCEKFLGPSRNAPLDWRLQYYSVTVPKNVRYICVISLNLRYSEDPVITKYLDNKKIYIYSLNKQIMSKDKYLIIFSPQMEAIVFVILQIFFATRAVFKIGEYLVNKPFQAVGMSADNVRG